MSDSETDAPLVFIGTSPESKPDDPCVSMDVQSIAVSSECLQLLNLDTKKWVTTLKPIDLSLLLQAMYKIPNLIETIRIDSLNSTSNKKTQNKPDEYSDCSALIGKSYELLFARICRALPANYVLSDTSKHGKAGDFILTYSNRGSEYRCLIELKKYTTTVPAAQIDKFYNDLSFGNYNAGIIISATSRFTGIHDSIHVEDKHLATGTIPIMMLSNVSDSTLILQCIQMLMIKIDIQPEYSIALDSVSNLITTINMSIGQSATTRRMLSDLNMTVSKSIQNCIENLISSEVHLKHTIKTMGRMLNEVDSHGVDSHGVDSHGVDSHGVDSHGVDFCELAKQCDKPMLKNILSMNWKSIATDCIIKAPKCILASNKITVEIVLYKTKTKLLIYHNDPNFNLDSDVEFKKLFESSGLNIFTSGDKTSYIFEKITVELCEYVSNQVN